MSGSDTKSGERLFDDAAERMPIDPFTVFEDWFADARASEVNDPHAMALATVDEAGLPDMRMVLMNARDARGPVFFTNLESAKGRQLLAHPQAAALFHWKSLRRQVRFRGPIERVSDAEADAYFSTRGRQSQIGAHASAQSRPLASRVELEQRAAALAEEFGEGPVPRPAHWSGFRLTPLYVEFWKDGPHRLHDRVLFRRENLEAEWTGTRLNP